VGNEVWKWSKNWTKAVLEYCAVSIREGPGLVAPSFAEQNSVVDPDYLYILKRCLHVIQMYSCVHILPYVCANTYMKHQTGPGGELLFEGLELLFPAGVLSFDGTWKYVFQDLSSCAPRYGKL
jgi:hypothetical protein